MTLRKQIEPLLEDFKRANGKGSLVTANIAMTKIIETLLSHIEQQSIFSGHTIAANPPPTAWETVSLTDEVLPSDGPPPSPDEPLKSALLNAVRQLHDANYVIGPDYTAIVDHLEDNPDTSPVKAEKVRKRPARKPKEGTMPGRRPGRPKRIANTAL